MNLVPWNSIFVVAGLINYKDTIIKKSIYSNVRLENVPN